MKKTVARPLSSLLLCAMLAAAGPGTAQAQRPTPEQAKALLQTRPDLVNQLRGWISNSGLTPEQIRNRLSSAGYPDNLLDPYLPDSSDSSSAAPSARVMQAVRSLGLSGLEEVPTPDTVMGLTGERRHDLGPAGAEPTPVIFGLDVFRKVSSQFQPNISGPVDPSYRLGPGDVVVLILTGDVELAHSLEVTREGFVVIPQVGQLYVSGLTLSELEALLYTRLSRVYSGIKRGPGASTHFQVTVSKLRTNQVYVIGEVMKPGSYQISSVGTVLTALYLAGGPKETGSMRRVEIRRGSKLIDSLDLYDYLLRGNNSHDIRLETGDVVFVPVRGVQVEITGAVTRPAIYELASKETLHDLVASAGGFQPFALQKRIQVDRILPPAERQPGGRDRVVLDISADQFADGAAPAFPLVAGDRVKVFSIAERRRDVITVTGDVWTEGTVGFTPGMRLSQAIKLAGGPKPDVYLGQIQITRLNPDSTRIQLRSSFRDSTGALTNDLLLREDDDIRVFSRTEFRPQRYVVITGAVRRPGSIPFREGMSLRDVVLEAEGLTEDALIGDAEIARLPEDRSDGALATTIRVQLDSSYVFDRGPNGEYLGPPGVPGKSSGAPDIPLRPYDNVLILRQPDWELHRTVVISGKVRYPGTYALRNRTERITDLINRAGGLVKEAYPNGAELFRRLPPKAGTDVEVVHRLQRITGRDSLGRRIVDSIPSDSLLAQRVGLELPKALERPTSNQDLILQSGDSLWIPEFNPTVRVVGAINAPTNVIQRNGWDLDDYVAAAGGYARRADKSRSYVIQPGGRVESVKRRFLLPDGKPTPQPGAVVYVPERDPADKRDFVALFASIAQILASAVTLIVVSTR